MMKRIVLNPIRIDSAIEKTEALKSMLTAPKDYETIEAIMEKNKASIKPKAILKECSIEIPRRHWVKIDGHSFHSPLLFDKLFHQEKVFAAIVTSGDELDQLTKAYPTKLVNVLQYALLTEARKEVRRYLEKHHGYQDIAALSPGSLPDWPIEHNKALFDLVGNASEIGVVLKSDGFMTPINSVSGILYSGDKGYVNCSLCKKETCIGRKAPFDEKEYSRIFDQS